MIQNRVDCVYIDQIVAVRTALVCFRRVRCIEMSISVANFGGGGQEFGHSDATRGDVATEDYCCCLRCRRGVSIRGLDRPVSAAARVDDGGCCARIAAVTTNHHPRHPGATVAAMWVSCCAAVVGGSLPSSGNGADHTKTERVCVVTKPMECEMTNRCGHTHNRPWRFGYIFPGSVNS